MVQLLAMLCRAEYPIFLSQAAATSARPIDGLRFSTFHLRGGDLVRIFNLLPAFRGHPGIVNFDNGSVRRAVRYHPATSFCPVILVGVMRTSNSPSTLFLSPYFSANSSPIYLPAMRVAQYLSAWLSCEISARPSICT